MSSTPSTAPSRSVLPWLLVAGLAVASGGVSYAVLRDTGETKPTAGPEPQMLAEPREATAEEVHRVCAVCHVYPPAETFPRADWRKEVKLGFDFLYADPSPKYRFEFPPLESIVRYYETQAPESLSPVSRSESARPVTAFERRSHRPPRTEGPPGVAHINLVHLSRKDRLDVLVCDANSRQVLVFKPYESPPAWTVIARGFTCAHAEVADLDADGVSDVLLSCLGNFYATDDLVGSVVWLKGTADGTFTPFTLLEGIGRVADVRAADFTGDGRVDLVVAEFGWHKAGSIRLLENTTTDWSKPVFESRTIDPRHGTTHVPVADLNGDGKPDFVAVVSQGHETVVAFLNRGGGKFDTETVFAGPHPTYGLNGAQVIDLDGDGDLDVLLSNGDALDHPHLLRPDHGVTWLENRGGYPFHANRLADAPGAGSPVAADFDGNGLLDVAFASFLLTESLAQRDRHRPDAVVVLEQAERGKFVRHMLEASTCIHPACAAGDLDGDGRPDLVIGHFVRVGDVGDRLTVWRNTTPKAPAKR
jgi:hypothetical protein